MKYFLKNAERTKETNLLRPRNQTRTTFEEKSDWLFLIHNWVNIFPSLKIFDYYSDVLSVSDKKLEYACKYFLF